MTHIIGATYSGLVADGLHVINIMSDKTQTHRMIYSETESVETMAREIAEEMQMATQYGGIRPYAVSLLIGGIDKEPKALRDRSRSLISWLQG